MTSGLAALPASLQSYFAKSGIALALSDSSEDAPLVLVNPAFCKLTGYAEDEVVGRNCRFLQGPDTTAESRAKLHEFVHDDSIDDGRFPILNYRKDGSSFHNLVFMTRLRSDEGETRFILASQFDMSSTSARAKISENDARLSQHLRDIQMRGKEFGLAMASSADTLSESIAMLARLSLGSSK